jgi:cell division septation protein DedD
MMGALALAGCAEGQMPGFLRSAPEQTDTTAAADAVTTVERDVETPEAFQVAASGLWDGRPSLGGVWVAHQDVREPERVIIRNTGNGQFVIGALFRRERLNPGPAFQVSSDAAAALGMLAGAPAPLEVTALRRAEVPVEPPKPEPAPVTAATATGAAAPSAIAAKPLDEVTSAAAAAIDSAEARTTAPPRAPNRAAPARPTQPVAETVQTAGPVAPATASHPRPFLQVGIFSSEANANRAGDQMRVQGVVPTIRKETSQGKTFWRVVVGPTNTSDDRDDILKKARDAGFGDAYFVRN